MPNLRQMSATERPLARSRSASRRRRRICSAVRRLPMSPSWTYPIRIGTLITAGPDFGEQPTRRFWLAALLFSLCNQFGVLLLWQDPLAGRSEDIRPPGEHIVTNHEEVKALLNSRPPP